MKTTRVPNDGCPVCLSKLNAATDFASDASPRAGDLSVCISCGSFLVFKDDLTHRELSMEELSELDDETRIQLQRGRRLVQEAASRRSLGEDS